MAEYPEANVDEANANPRTTQPETAKAAPSQLSKASTGGVERRRNPPREESIAPLSAFRRFMDDMDHLFSGFGFGNPLTGGIGSAELLGGGWSPAIETMEKGDRLVFRADLPGLSKDDVNVEIVDDELVVSGERRQEREEKKPGRYYSERRYGSFERRIELPEDVDPDSVEASFDNGVLEISVAIPEREETSRVRKIEVKSAARERGEQASDTGVDSIH